MEDFKKLSSDEKLNAIYGMLLGSKNVMAATKLKIIEWNINGRTHCNIDNDIIETIKKQEADIIVLTEVPNGRDTLNLLKASLKETYRICLCEPDNQSKHLVLVLIRHSLISPDSDPIVQNRSNEDCNLLTVRFSSTNRKEYFVVGCRMTTGGEDLTELYDSEREAFDDVLIPAVKETCGKDEICMIAGDFNNAQCRGDLQFKFNPKDYEGKAQLHYNLNIIKDAFEEIGFALADNTKNGIHTFRYRPNRNIPNDHIFVKGCHVRTAYPVPVHESLSDHDIICAEISIE